MQLEEIEKQYGPVLIIQTLADAIKNPDNIRPALVHELEPEKVDIGSVLTNEPQPPSNKSGWDKLVALGIDLDDINRIKKKVEKMNTAFPLAKL